MAILNSHIIRKLSHTKAAALSRKDFDYRTYTGFVHNNLAGLKHTVVGQSVEGKDILAFDYGRGPVKVLIWSQMHGNEPSSTLALLQVLEFLAGNDLDLTRKIYRQLTIRAIPVLNPDGAERKIRRNAQNIDLNRDALQTVAPESRILTSQLENFAPHWAFNLHDQELYYGTDTSDLPTAMALLAPSTAPGVSQQARHKAMELIGAVAREFSREINVARYSDAYMPTAFGDYFSTRGVSTVLFETGYIIGDRDRKKTTAYVARAILSGLALIAGGIFNAGDRDFYMQIPFNRKHRFYDVILKNVRVKSKTGEFLTDVALCRDRRNREHFTDYDRDFYVYDVGDLRFGKAFEIVDCAGNLVLEVSGLALYAPGNSILEKCADKLSIFS